MAKAEGIDVVYEVALIVLCACPSGKSEHLQTLAELQSLLDGTMTVDFAVAAEERASSAARCAASLMGAWSERSSKNLPLDLPSITLTRNHPSPRRNDGGFDRRRSKI